MNYPVNGTIPRRPLGSTGESVSLLGLGGGHIGNKPSEAEAIRIVQQAIDAGVTFMDNAWDYNDGESERRMGKALAEAGYRQKVFLMTKDCAHDRRANTSMLRLEQSLKRLKTDYLDLWQLHEVVWEDDPDWIFAPGGSAEFLLKAKEQGKVRYIGFTGHKSPAIHKRMLAQDFPWDTVQMPLNVFDAHYESFEREIIPICQQRGLGILGMKSFSGGDVFKTGVDITPAEALRYTMSLPVATVISGIDSLAVLEQNLAIAQNFQPLSPEERTDILRRSAPVATGQFERFKTTRDFEGDEGRVAHEYPIRSAAAD